MTARPIREVLAERSPAWMQLPGVVGVYESRLDDGRACIKVLLAEPNPETEARLPAEVEGYPVVVEVSGEIRGLGERSD